MSLEATNPIHQAFAELAADARFSSVDMSLTRARVANEEPTYLIRLTLPELSRLGLLSELGAFAAAHELEGVMEIGGGVALIPLSS